MSVTQMMTDQADLIPFIWGNLGTVVVLYLYLGLCMYFIARKTNTPYEWMAWVPIANLVLMFMVAKKPWWWIFLMLIPIVNIVIMVLTWMGMARARGKAGWVGILIIIPLVNLIIPGYLAFSE